MSYNIIVIDDQSSIRNLVGHFLQTKGNHVTLCGGVEEALAYIRGAPADVVVTDIDMPGTDGLHGLKILRKFSPTLPIIMMTGMGYDEELLQEAKQNGASGYVSKLLPLDQLLMEIHRVIKYAANQQTEPAMELKKPL